MRCFIAIELPEDIKNFIDQLVNLKSSVEGVNLVKKENLHLTLKFLGEIEIDLIPSIVNSLRDLAKEFSPFTLKISHPGVFPDKVKPRVIWIGLEYSEILKDLAVKVDEEIYKFGIEKEQRRFKSHITIARVKNFQNGRYIFEKIWKTFKENNLIDNPAQKPHFHVTEFVLMKSTLTPKGSIYEVLERFPLSDNINGIIKQNA